MQREYTEQDTERVRQLEAGMAADALATPGVNTATVARSGNPGNRQAWLGIGLIGIGALLLVAQFTQTSIELVPGLILFTIASCFFFFAAWRHVYGLLIPACILAGLSLGVPFAAMSNGISVLWGLALGFLAILALGRALFGRQSIWPVYPAVPLFAVGIIVAITSLPTLFLGGLIWLPLLLIGAGLYLGWGRHRQHGS